MLYRNYGRMIAGALTGLVIAACRTSDLLNVPTPVGQIVGSTLKSEATAEGAFFGDRSFLLAVVGSGGGVAQWTGLLSDEMTWTDATSASNGAGIDARKTATDGIWQESGDNPLSELLTVRSNFLVDVPRLEQNEIGSAQSHVGEAFALIGYTELFLSEDYCAGAPLSQDLPDGGIVYGHSVSSDSLLGFAEAHFDSALKHTAGNATVEALASVGLGRVLLDRKQYAAASTAVANVPTNFTYVYFATPNDIQAQGLYNFFNKWYQNYPPCDQYNIADREGLNGENFLSAADPRLLVDSTLTTTCNGFKGVVTPSNEYIPPQYASPTSVIPLTTGVEARLIQAEAALPQNGGNATTWASYLNALRDSAPETYLQLDSSFHSLSTDSTVNASAEEQVKVMFRERAFWLFGTGTRLGDMRRLIRQYGFQADSVFPTGAYAPGNNPAIAAYFPERLTQYGTDVSLTLPTATSGYTTNNPYYKGCLTPTTTA